MAAEDNAETMRTERLILRPWRDSDIEPFAAMNADPRVMEFFPKLATREETEAMVGRLRAHFEKHGFAMWALELPGVAPFIGFAGLVHVSFEAPFTPAVEMGWRLAHAHWGRGYATEAARAALRYGFERLGLPEIVAFAAAGNRRSTRVMEKLGMRYDEHADFDHPRSPPDSPHRRHVLYRIARP